MGGFLWKGEKAPKCIATSFPSTSNPETPECLGWGIDTHLCVSSKPLTKISLLLAIIQPERCEHGHPGLAPISPFFSFPFKGQKKKGTEGWGWAVTKPPAKPRLTSSGRINDCSLNSCCYTTCPCWLETSVIPI